MSDKPKLQDVSALSVEFMVEAKTKDLENALTQSSLVIKDLIQVKKELEAKVKHLEELLTHKSSNLHLNIPSEEQICIEQIEKIRNKSMIQELNLEDTKKLETFVKTLQSIRKESTTTVNIKHQNLSTEELLSIANSNE